MTSTTPIDTLADQLDESPVDDVTVIDANTTTETDTDGTQPEDASEASPGGRLCWLPLSSLAPHPDNPRTGVGDITELVRSVRSQGVLEPLLVLPADDDGTHVIVAGHRRHAAAQEAEVEQVPVVVRVMTPAEAIEAMLSENANRDGLTISEEVRAIERLMSLQDGLTPAKLCRRIGKSQAWVRSRMAVTVLPAPWRQALDESGLTLAAAEAAASVADLGPEHLDAVCGQLAGKHWLDPARVVSEYRDGLRRDAAYAEAVERETKAGRQVLTDNEVPGKSKPLTDLFGPEAAKVHVDEPCHAVVMRRVGWGDGVSRVEHCTDPRRHTAKRVESGKGSSIAADRGRQAAVRTESSHAKRKGRLARLDHARTVWAKTRGGASQAELTRLALRALVPDAGVEALGYAATILGYDEPRSVTAEALLAQADTPAKLARVAGAVACGIAESHMYGWATGTHCRDYLDLLCGSGWQPDDWTATVLDRHSQNPTEPARDEVEDELGDQTGDELTVEDEPGDPPVVDEDGPEDATTTDETSTT